MWKTHSACCETHVNCTQHVWKKKGLSSLPSSFSKVLEAASSHKLLHNVACRSCDRAGSKWEERTDSFQTPMENYCRMQLLYYLHNFSWTPPFFVSLCMSPPPLSLFLISLCQHIPQKPSPVSAFWTFLLDGKTEKREREKKKGCCWNMCQLANQIGSTCL